MGSQFLEEQQPTDANKKLTDTFNEVCPFYLSIGMTYDQFWNDDVSMVVMYRKANDLKIEQQNQQAWLQGMYIYDAVSTVITNVWCKKKGQKPSVYAQKPYDFKKEKLEEETVEEEKIKAQAWMINFVNSFKK